jgi:RNA polymerase sigma-70 factor (ECF subfamily)
MPVLVETPRATEDVPRDQGWAELLERLAQTDKSALAELYDLSSSAVFGLVLRIVGDRSDAEEVTLDVYMQVWKQAERYDSSRGRVLSWLLTIARSRAIDRLRSKAAKDRGREQPLDAAGVAEVADASLDPEQSSFEATRKTTVLTALDSLQTDQRQAIELAYFAGMSHSEIADRTGQPLGTVKTRIRVGMLRLRKTLQPLEEAI